LLQYDRDGALAANGVPPLATGPNPNWMHVPAGWFPIGRNDPLTDSLVDSEPPIQDLTTLVPEAETATAFIEGEYRLTDTLTAYGEVLLSRRKTTNVGWRQIWTYVYNYDSADLGFPSDPFSEGWTGAQWLSPLTLTDHSGQRVTVDYQRFVAGLRGELDKVLPDWSWEVSLQYSDSDGEYEDDQILNDALTLPFFRTGSCVGEVTEISKRDCVDIQWLDPDFLAGDIPQQVKDYLFGVETGKTEYTQWSMEAYLSGEVMDLPAGPLAVAVGVHYQEDKINDVPGPITMVRGPDGQPLTDENGNNVGNAWGA